MPANLTPQYFEAERTYRAASTVEDKLEGLERMLSVMPKHKGTDHLRAELTSKIARLRAQLELANSGGRRRAGYYVKKEGAGQVALVGLTNSGKSHHVSSLTGVITNIGDYSFVTRDPLPAMMKFENVPIQLVDMPALNYAEARPWLASILRNADLWLVVVELSTDPVEQVEKVIADLAGLRLEPASECASVGAFSSHKKGALLVANKSDSEGAAARLQALNAGYGGRLASSPSRPETAPISQS